MLDSVFHTPGTMARPPDELLTSHLRSVSRSFYPTLRVLPSSVRPQMSLAYLLARTADSIADLQLTPLDQRLAALQQLRERIEGSRQDPLNLSELPGHHDSPADRLLLENCERTLSRLDGFSPADVKLIREILASIISGQELDLKRFASASAENIKSVQTEAELD